jgi:hypothetical protein
MTIRLLPVCATLLFAASLAGPASAQTAGTPAGTAAGHWTGAVETPGQPLEIQIDLKPTTPPEWMGTISIAAQNIKALPLEKIEAKDKAVSFVIKQAPGTPTFTGTLSADGATITGEFTQGGASFPFKLTRAGEAVFPPPPPKSTAIGKELEGTWAGALEVGGRTLRLTLKLANGADGATGSIISVDQGNAEVSIASIVQKDAHLELQLPAISGGWSGDLKDGKLVGTWTQGPGSNPLEFTRPSP